MQAHESKKIRTESPEVSYSVFSSDDERLLRVGTCPRNKIKGMANEGEIAREGDHRPALAPGDNLVGPKQVKACASRLFERTRIRKERHEEQVSLGIETSITSEAYRALLEYRQAIRAASNALEAMDTIPLDYADPKWWPDAP